MIRWFFIRRDLLDALMTVGNNSPNKEVCGIITGTITDDKKLTFAHTLYEVPNIADSNMQYIDYMMEPKIMYKILEKTTLINKDSDEDFIAIWHTRPNGAPIPSDVDLKRATYNVVYLIYSPILQEVRAYNFDKKNNRFNEIVLQVL